MADNIPTYETLYRIYKARLDTYTDALYYDNGRNGMDVYNKFSSAHHALHKHLMDNYYKTGITEVMLDKMYSFHKGGPFNELPGRSYISLRKPEIKDLYDKAETARTAHNIYISGKLNNYICRIIQIKPMLKNNLVPSHLLDKAKKFVAFEDRITEIYEKGMWEISEAGAKYFEWDETDRYNREKRKFEREHPGYAQESKEAHEEDFRYQMKHGRVPFFDTLSYEVDKRYGWEPPVSEKSQIMDAAKVFYDLFKSREQRIYEKQKSLNNLENMYRAIDKVLKEFYSKWTSADCEDFWRRHFDLPYYTYSDKKPVAVKPAPKKEEPKPTPKPASKPAPKKAEPKPAVQPTSQPSPAPSVVSTPEPARVWQPPKELQNDFRISGELFRKYVGKGDSVLLPMGIKRIWETAFQSAKDFLRVVVIPEGVTEIVRYTFKDCVKLEKVELPSTLKSIEFNAFEGCSSLKEINFPSAMRYIGSSAFEGCTSLKSVKLPKDCSVETSTYSGSFPSTCKVSFVEEKELNANGAPTSLPKTDPSLFKIENGNCKKYLGKEDVVVIPDGVVKVGSSSFGLARKFVKHVVIPEGVKEIGSLAFCDCVKLERVELPSTLKIIKNQVFQNCANLKHVKLPQGMQKVEAWAFRGCTGLKTLTIPKGCSATEYICDGEIDLIYE